MRSRTPAPDAAPFPQTRREARLAERRAAEAGPGAVSRSETATWDGRITDPVLIQPDDAQAARRPGPLPAQRTASAGELIRPAGPVPQQVQPLAPQQVQAFAPRQASALPRLPLRPPVPAGELPVSAPVPLVDGGRPVGPAPAGRHAAGATGLGHWLGSLPMSASVPGAPRPRGRRVR